MTAVLIVTACLIGQPGTCQDYRVPIYEPITVEQCNMVGMPIVASWSAGNPDKKIMRWRCRAEMEL